VEETIKRTSKQIKTGKDSKKAHTAIGGYAGQNLEGLFGLNRLSAWTCAGEYVDVSGLPKHIVFHIQQLVDDFRSYGK